MCLHRQVFGVAGKGGKDFWEANVLHRIGKAIFRVRDDAVPQESHVVGTQAEWKLEYMHFFLKSQTSGYPFIVSDYVPPRYDVPATQVHGATIRIVGDGVFMRGDSNQDATVDLSDAVNTLNVLFLGSGSLRCADAADANDDGPINIADAIYTLSHLFTGGPEPPPPFPSAGRDITDDPLDC